MKNAGKLCLVALMVAVMVVGLWENIFACPNISNVTVDNNYPESITIQFSASGVTGTSVWVYSTWGWTALTPDNGDLQCAYTDGLWRMEATGTWDGPFASNPIDLDKGFYIGYYIDLTGSCEEDWTCNYMKAERDLVMGGVVCSTDDGSGPMNLDATWPLITVDPPVDNDFDGYFSNEDCDDNDDSVYPDAPEVCDGKNNDCNDPFWPDLPGSEQDNDQDQYRACEECNDNDPTIHPGAPELCDGKDNDCNGLIDETVVPPEGNLLVNPGFETGNGSGWTQSYPGTLNIGDGQNQVPSYEFVDYEGRYYAWQIFTSGCSGLTSGGLYQDVDVTAYNNAIDQGLVTITADGLFQRWQSWG